MEATRSDCPTLIGESPCIQEVQRLIDQVAATSATVLVTGESGTGKEVIAANIHARSSVADGPFVTVNCGAIPEELLESELFGHEKGAFTGALTSRPGRFEMAEGGTLFLDEIGDMPQHMQVKLLRVLQERTYCRLGSNEERHANVRVVAATHQNLAEQIEKGDFRLDLFYRLNVFPIEVAPLRERKADILLLIEAFVERSCQQGFTLSDSALLALMNYCWPGNVRELANLVERLAILHDGAEVGLRDLPPGYCQGITAGDVMPRIGPKAADRAQAEFPRAEGESIDLRQYLQSMEINMIRDALDEADWVVARGAKLLGLQRTTLIEKMRKYSIDRMHLATQV